MNTPLEKILPNTPARTEQEIKVVVFQRAAVILWDVSQ
jgi:hypothetical protein